MWTVLTNTNEAKCLIDLSKSTDIQPTKAGTRITFNSVAQNSDGKHVGRTVVVIESIDHIAKLLKAKE